MAQNETIYINFTGGIISPGYLKEVLTIAASAKVTHVRFGLRQQLSFELSAKHLICFKKDCAQKSITFFTDRDATPNIVSSYPAAGIFTADTWLREGVYKDIFDSFQHVPTLKVNICDSTQNLVPFFSGHINWVSSASPHYWYLYWRFPSSLKVFCCKALVYTNDLAAVSKLIAQQIHLIKDTQHISEQEACAAIFEYVKLTTGFISKPVEEELTLPHFSLPYYEGFNASDVGTWLGVYRRDELFPINFMMDVCTLCMETKVGQLYTTSWKSIIVKGIEKEHRNRWEFVLGKYRINVRHAANELNWQVEDESEEGLLIKRHIIRYFDKEDVRTEGLSFAVQTQPFSSMSGTVVIRKQQIKNPNRLKSLERFDILYAPDFKPNTSSFVTFRERVEKDHLGTYLVSLCKLFYEQQNDQTLVANTLTTSTITIQENNKIVHQCPHCCSIYDDAIGDADQLIAPGTPFNQLPIEYCCPLCEAGKESFLAVDEKKLQLQLA